MYACPVCHRTRDKDCGGTGCPFRPIRYLTTDEQRVFQSALRKSIKVVAVGVKSD